MVTNNNQLGSRDRSCAITSCAFTCILAVAACISLLTVLSYSFGRDWGYNAIYDDYVFYGDRRKVFSGFAAHTLGNAATITAHIYVRLPNNNVELLSELTEDSVKQFAEKRADVPEIRYIYGDSSFTFVNGKLDDVFIGKDLGLSLNRDGPYLTLPARDRELRAAFGKPERYVVVKSTLP